MLIRLKHWVSPIVEHFFQLVFARVCQCVYPDHRPSLISISTPIFLKWSKGCRKRHILPLTLIRTVNNSNHNDYDNGVHIVICNCFVVFF